MPARYPGSIDDPTRADGPAPFRPLARPQSLSELAYEQLRAGILAGELRVGDRVTVGTVAERMSISRSPVRAAVERLAAEGLITIDANGIELVGYNRDDLLRVMAVRQPLEGLAARLAAEDAAPAERAALRQLHQRFVESAERGEHQTSYTLDVGFHEMMWAICGNDVLEQELQRLHARGIVASFTTSWTRVHVEAVEEHSAVVDAIEAGDGAAAAAAAIAHIGALMERVRSGVQRPSVP